MQFINEIVQIYLPSTNIRRSVEWYVEVFGYSVIWETDDCANLKLSQGPLLFLKKTDQPQSVSFVSDNQASPVISFKSSNFLAFHEWLKAKGINVSDINEYGAGDTGPNRDFIVIDPDQNVIEVNEFSDLKLPQYRGY